MAFGMSPFPLQFGTRGGGDFGLSLGGGVTIPWDQIISRYNGEAFLPAGDTFARASSGWLLADGSTLTAFSTNVPRIAGGSVTVEGARTNFVPNGNNISTWNKRGTCAASFSSESTLLSGLQSGNNDIYTNSLTSGLSLGDPLAISLSILRVSTSNIVSLQNSSTNTRGEWSINLASLPDEWVNTFTSMTGVTIVDPFEAYTSGVAGFLIRGSNTTQLSLRVKNLNMQAGNFSSTPIATSGGSATRAAESWITDLGTPASVTCRARGVAASGLAGNQVLIQADDGSQDDRITARRDSSGDMIAELYAGGVEQATLNLGAVANSSAVDVLVTCGYDAELDTNVFSARLGTDPMDAQTATGVTLPDITTGRTGCSSSAGSEWFGQIIERVWA